MLVRFKSSAVCYTYIYIYTVNKTFLTAVYELFVRAIPTVIEAITDPGLTHTQMVQTLELVCRAPTPSWVTSGWCGEEEPVIDQVLVRGISLEYSVHLQFQGFQGHAIIL